MVSASCVIVRIAMTKKAEGRAEETGRLRIGDVWNAITIIAMSQSNPLKAVAEFVENSIDAKARHITIIRGKEKGKTYLRIVDDGDGIPRDEQGTPDFKYVATHICDSIKRRMKKEGVEGIQGEFGIGLLSFWTVGKELTLSSSGEDGHVYEIRMVKEKPGFTVRKRRMLLADKGTELTVTPLLAGIRQLSGDKIQWYLASELRDRIRTSGVDIKVIDRQARKEFKVEPRQFEGRLLHELPVARTPYGDIYLELYLADANSERKVGVHRSGTRVLESICDLDGMRHEPWTSDYIEGIIDGAFLNLTPGTRGGIIHDERLSAFCSALRPVETRLLKLIKEQCDAEDQRASKRILKSIQKALREALLSLPSEEYDWFDVRSGGRRGSASVSLVEEMAAAEAGEGGVLEHPGGEQKQFFEHEGPLFSVRISPASSVVQVNAEKNLRAVPRDKTRRLVEKNVVFSWRVLEGDGSLSNAEGECITFSAPRTPGLTRLEVTAVQGDVTCHGEALVTIAESLLPQGQSGPGAGKGLPSYTFHRAPGELWRSRYDAEKNLVVINNGHRDFVYASRSTARKLRYICRLFAKELVYRNFPGIPPEQLLERMIELSLYTEENLK
jgi:hypothetical protein